MRLTIFLLIILLSLTSCIYRENDIKERLKEPISVKLSKIVPVGHKAVLTWKETNLEYFSSYKIYRSLSPDVGNTHELVKVLTDPTILTYKDESTKQNTTYYYCVYTYSEAGKFSKSNIEKVETLYYINPSKVLYGDDITPGHIRITWAENQDVHFAKYLIYRGISEIDLEKRENLIDTVYNIKSNIYNDYNVSPDSTYYYLVVAENKFQQKSDYGPKSVKTAITGIVKSDLRFFTRSDTYDVDKITVEDGYKLIIDKGVSIKFKYEDSKLVSNGETSFNGEENSKIEIEAGKSFFDGIYINSNNQLSKINHTVIEEANYGIRSNYSRLEIKNCKFEKCKTALFLVENHNSKIENSVFLDCDTGIFSNSNLLIQHNNFLSSTQYGILTNSFSNINIKNNIFYKNSFGFNINGHYGEYDRNCYFENQNNHNLYTKTSEVYADPLFVDYGKDNFNLKENSPCMQNPSDEMSYIGAFKYVNN